MPSQLKSDTARANGAKSHGPKSAETRAISSRNSLSHGLTSRHTTLLQCENAGEFQEILASHFDAYRPANPAQQFLVNEMVSARWRIRRIRIVETALIDLEMTRNAAEIRKIYTEPDSGIHMAEAVRVLIEDSRSLSLISRYESRLLRLHERSYRTLRELQHASPHAPVSVSTGPAERAPLPPESDPPQTGVATEPAPSSEPECKKDETNPACRSISRRTPQIHDSMTPLQPRIAPARRYQSSTLSDRMAIRRLLRRK